MVSAIFIIAAGLGAGFLIGLLREDQKGAAFTVALAALGFMAWVSVSWFIALASGTAAPQDIITAGTQPPFAINLRMGLAEAGLLSVITLTGLLSLVYMAPALRALGRRALAVLVILVMALSGLVLTRDIFNLFVFFELVVIATGGLVLLSDDKRAVAAGFKYLVVSQIVGILLLIGIIFVYHANGSLNIDDIAAQPMGFTGAGLALFLLLIALVVELKPFPANGWALDIYEAAHPGVSALVSAASATAALYAADKLFAAAGPDWLPLATVLGLVSFLGANLLGLAQRNDRRLLGYSSIGQIGLVLVVVGQRDILGDAYLYVAGGILFTHAVAKAGLYWISGLVPGRDIADWAVLRTNPVLLFAFAAFIAMLLGLPPFAGFYAKWDLAHALAGADRLPVLGLVLVGALVEAGYLFRWFGFALKRPNPVAFPGFSTTGFAVVLAALAGGWGLGFVWGAGSVHGNLLLAAPLLFALAFLVLEPLPAWAKNLLAIAGLLGWVGFRAPGYDPLHLVFALVMLAGGAVILLASFAVKGERFGFYPSAMVMYAGLALLIDAQTSFQFFAAWELLTIGSYFLILRGKESEPHALSYILFSLGGAFAILAGFALASGGLQPFALDNLAAIAEAGLPLAPWVFLLLAIGFLTKTASVGFHIWLPGAHAEAETDVSPMVSGILLKAGLFGLWLLLMYMGRQSLFGVDLTYLLVWIGALSAFIGAVLAIFQEDAKRLLAYSSISQMGYALFGLALMNHLGWLLALMFVINHYVYKSMLFLAIGGVKERTHTKLMYKMGGLITIMPFTFVSVLVGIIAMSGVPPLSGFGGRWVFYNAIMSSEMRLPVVLIFMSGPIAFLYLFRLIHTIFLGQLKDEHRKLKEASGWLLAPQMIFVAFLIGFAILPGMVLQRVDAYIGGHFGSTALAWSGRSITSEFGYWNPVAIMIVIGVIFVIVLALLVAMNRNAQKVKQFNIVFSAERPFKPQTTHFAWNFFAPYRKALGFLEAPHVTRFWGGITDSLHATADFTRRTYTGNGQTYAAQVIVFVVAVYLVVLGGVS
jgi:formate hydrogenlyase subunit 3/multisubunit Na+/H+ antiporter MnhD subunit